MNPGTGPRFWSPPVHVAFRAYMGAARWLRTRRWVARRLFGLELPPGSSPGVLWDFTTLVLRKALQRHVRDGQRVHEIGIGEVGVLCVFLHRRHRLIQSGVDVQESRVRAARVTLAFNGITDVTLERSDLFENTAERYDRIVFNAAYIPSEVGRRMGFLADKTLEAQRSGWDGGDDGLVTVRRFLRELPSHLEPGGLGLLGVNTVYVPETRVREAAATSGLAVKETVRVPFNPSVVLVLAPVVPG